MTGFPAAVRHGLRNLLKFRGRDTRSQFWFYILGLFVAQQVLTMLLVVPIMAGVDFSGTGPSHNPAPFIATFRMIMGAALLLPVLAIVLIAAALVRRLHDRGLSGWWGAMPLPFLALGTVGMLRLFSTFTAPEPDLHTGLFALMFANNAVYLLTLLVLVILLVKGSDPGPNRYGPPSAP